MKYNKRPRSRHTAKDQNQATQEKTKIKARVCHLHSSTNKNTTKPWPMWPETPIKMITSNAQQNNLLGISLLGSKFLGVVYPAIHSLSLPSDTLLFSFFSLSFSLVGPHKSTG